MFSVIVSLGLKTFKLGLKFNYLFFALGIVGSYATGLGWGGNGAKKDYILVFGFLFLLLPGVYFTFTSGGWISGIIYIIVAAGLTRHFAESFARKYGTKA